MTQQSSTASGLVSSAQGQPARQGKREPSVPFLSVPEEFGARLHRAQSAGGEGSVGYSRHHTGHKHSPSLPGKSSDFRSNLLEAEGIGVSFVTKTDRTRRQRP